jgi:hypothetical protein
MTILHSHAAPCNVIDELPPEITDQYEPTQADFEWMRACDLDSFIARDLTFADWIAEKARQAAILEDDRHGWLSGHIARLAQLVRWTGATTPEEHEDRMEVYERELRERTYTAVEGGAA